MFARRLIVCFLPLFWIAVATASLGVISLEELTNRAELIVYGRVVSIEASTVLPDGISEGGGVPVSMATIRILPYKILKGDTEDGLLVRSVENMEDSPRFRKGQEVFLFLTRNTDDSTYLTIGLTQGKFDVINGMVVREARVSVGSFMESILRLVHAQGEGVD